jgi:hypothetical protein
MVGREGHDSATHGEGVPGCPQRLEIADGIDDDCRTASMLGCLTEPGREVIPSGIDRSYVGTRRCCMSESCIRHVGRKDLCSA